MFRDYKTISLCSLSSCTVATGLASLAALVPVLNDITSVRLQVTDAVVASLRTVFGLHNDEHGNLHNAIFLLERLLASLIVVLDCLPWHFGEVAIKGGLVTILADKDDFELLVLSVDEFIVLLKGLSETAAAWSPMSTEVEADVLDVC